MAGVQSQLGQPVWKPGSPAGWDDIAASWAAPDALLRRVEFAQRLVAPIGDTLDARTLGPKLMPASSQCRHRRSDRPRREPRQRARAAARLARFPEEMSAMLDRRRFLSFAALGAGALLVAPRMALATVATDRRFVFIIQRGAADGLNIVVPYADPAYARLRGALAIDPSSATKLDGTFALHPSLVETAKMYGQHQALFVHAIASPYRDRSHFDGQNVLETGGTQPYQAKDGWLNRLVAMMPRARRRGDRARGDGADGACAAPRG